MTEAAFANTHPNPSDRIAPRLQLVAWEITRSCNLFCAHCRASAAYGRHHGELPTEQCLRIIDGILQVGKPVLILSGGEPLLRPDVFQVTEYAVSKGLRVVMGSNGTLITEGIAMRLKEAGVSRIGVSLDFAAPELQDKFRGKAGAFEAALAGIAEAGKAGIDVQINTTVTKLNARYLDELLDLALMLGAVAFHPFMLVPTGRGKELEAEELSPEEYESALNWIYDKQAKLGDRMFFKPTDAPHYMRVVMQRDAETSANRGSSAQTHSPMSSFTRGCLAGLGFCFISHRGKVQGCGYLDVEAGSIRQESFKKIWDDSPLFAELRDLSNIRGKCGVCEYKRVCGGCRARAYEATGDHLGPEPYCIYEPMAPRS